MTGSRRKTKMKNKEVPNNEKLKSIEYFVDKALDIYFEKVDKEKTIQEE